MVHIRSTASMFHSALASAASFFRPIDNFLARLFQPVDDLLTSNPDLVLVARTVCVLALVLLLLLSVRDALCWARARARRRGRGIRLDDGVFCEEGGCEKDRIRRAMLIREEYVLGQDPEKSPWS